MLAARVIPVMLCRGRHLVKGERFVNSRVVGVALQAAKVHAARGVDELCILDVEASAMGRLIDTMMVQELTHDCFIPVTVGGGVRTVGDVDKLLRCGADKVLIGSAARRDLSIVREASRTFGAQAIVVSIDSPCQGRLHAAQAVSAGAGEILLNNVRRDGTMSGLDIELIRTVAHAVVVPVIACGGFKDPEDARLAIKAGASGVGIGAAFLFTDLTPAMVSAYLKAHGVEVRT